MLSTDRRCPLTLSTRCHRSIDPDQNLAQGVSGADVVNENLRQLCVWNQAKATVKTDGGKKWWDYVKQFAKECHGEGVASDLTFTSTCSKAVHSRIEGLPHPLTKEAHLFVDDLFF